MGSAAARLLFLAGFEVLILECPLPLAVRRKVAFAEAVFTGTPSTSATTVSGVTRSPIFARPWKRPAEGARRTRFSVYPSTSPGIALSGSGPPVQITLPSRGPRCVSMTA